MAATGFKEGDVKRRKDGKFATSRRAQRQADISRFTGDSTPAVGVDEVTQCTFAFVAQSYGAATGGFRQCKNAIITPAVLCHIHGGGRDTSLGGKSVAKATAEAQRGELRRIPAEFWDTTDARLEAMRGDAVAMLNSNPEKFARMIAEAAAIDQQVGVGRFSANNQMYCYIQHLGEAHQLGLEGEDAWAYASEMYAQPHMTRNGWAAHGRTPEDGAEPAVVVAWRPSQGAEIVRNDGDTDEEFEARCRRGGKGYTTAVYEYPLSKTGGEPFEHATAMDVLHSGAHATSDPVEIQQRVDRLTGWLGEQGISVEWHDTRPAIADGYWQASANKIVVWAGANGGDPAARMHLLAHEAGHAVLGHGTDAGQESERSDKEAAAETVAYLVSARLGVNASDSSRVYIGNWQRDHSSSVQGAASMSTITNALKASNQILTGLDLG